MSDLKKLSCFVVEFPDTILISRINGNLEGDTTDNLVKPEVPEVHEYCAKSLNILFHYIFHEIDVR